jgi:hypothetical protein
MHQFYWHCQYQTYDWVRMTEDDSLALLGGLVGFQIPKIQCLFQMTERDGTAASHISAGGSFPTCVDVYPVGDWQAGESLAGLLTRALTGCADISSAG